MRNYYVVLGVNKGANLDNIQQAYRTVVKDIIRMSPKARKVKKDF